MDQQLSHDEHDIPAMTRGVRALLAINVAVLFLQWTVVRDADAFAVLGFQDGSIQRTLWTTITYMFVHYGVWHLALNMYALAAFGPRLEAAMGTRGFVLYYLWCGVGGAMAHLVFVRSGLLVGSTAAVIGILYAYWQQWPRDEIALFGTLPMRAWGLVLTLIAVNIAVGLYGAADPAAGGDRLAYLAHLGGLAFGWMYFRTPPAAGIDRFRHRISAAPDQHDEAPPRAIPRTLPRARTQQRDEVDEIVAKSKAVASQKRTSARAMVTPVRTSHEARAAELDRVLDKISSSGLESLSTDERAVLDDMAKRLREQG